MEQNESRKLGMHIRRNAKHDIYGVGFDVMTWVVALMWLVSFGLVAVAIKTSLIWLIGAVALNVLGVSGMLVVFGEMQFNDGVEAAAHEAEIICRHIDEYSDN